MRPRYRDARPIFDRQPCCDTSTTRLVTEDTGPDDDPVEATAREVDICGLLHPHVMLEPLVDLLPALGLGKDRDEHEAGNTRSDSRVGGLLHALTVNQRRLVETGAVRAIRSLMTMVTRPNLTAAGPMP